MKPATAHSSAWTVLVRCSWRLLALVGLAGLGVLLLGAPANAACTEPSCAPKPSLVDSLLGTVTDVVTPTVKLLQPKAPAAVPSPAAPSTPATPAGGTGLAVPAASAPSSQPAAQVGLHQAADTVDTAPAVVEPVVDLTTAVVGVAAHQVTDVAVPALSEAASAIVSHDAVLAVPGVLALPLGPGAKQAGETFHGLVAGAADALVGAAGSLTTTVVSGAEQAVTTALQDAVSPVVAPVDDALGALLPAPASGSAATPSPSSSGSVPTGAPHDVTLSPAWSVTAASATPVSAGHLRTSLGAGRDVSGPVPPPDQAVEPTTGSGSAIPGLLVHDQASHLASASGSSSVAGSNGGPTAPGATDLGAGLPRFSPASREATHALAAAPTARLSSAPDEEPPASPD